MIPSQSLSILSQVSEEGDQGTALQEEVVSAPSTQVVVVDPEARQAPIQTEQEVIIGAISSSMIPSQSSSMLLQISIQAVQAIQEFQVRIQAEQDSVPDI